ncbi:CoA pyrophosphatase [Bacillus timonensis]|nr:CoA pyrophosphatase [Bacillus timonensis]
MNMEEKIKKLQDQPPKILGSEHFSKYAVLLPLIKKDDDYHILFEVRSEHLRRQPGEICFPGGRIDQGDRDERHTAIRETTEELGIHEDQLTYVSPLDYIVTPFGTMIYPFVGILAEPEKINPNADEVGSVFSVPISYFKENPPKTYHIHFHMEPEDQFPFDDIIGGENYNWHTRKMDENFYYYEDKVIWGLTARILKHFLSLITE